MPEPYDVSSPSNRALGVRRLRGPSGDTWTEPFTQPGSVPYLREQALLLQAYPTTARRFQDEANALEIQVLRQLLDPDRAGHATRWPSPSRTWRACVSSMCLRE